jgi:hypothetical protein
MKQITLIVLPNQNSVTSSEISKIKRGLKKHFDTPVKFNVIANDDAEELDIYSEESNPVKGDYILIGTDDTNNKVSARVLETTLPGTSDFGIRL